MLLVNGDEVYRISVLFKCLLVVLVVSGKWFIIFIGEFWVSKFVVDIILCKYKVLCLNGFIVVLFVCCFIYFVSLGIKW